MDQKQNHGTDQRQDFPLLCKDRPFILVRDVASGHDGSTKEVRTESREREDLQIILARNRTHPCRQYRSAETGETKLRFASLGNLSTQTLVWSKFERPWAHRMARCRIDESQIDNTLVLYRRRQTFL
jgi:hypothetical protein